MIVVRTETSEVRLAAGERLTIGRDGSSDLVVDHPLVSRNHAVVEPVGDRFQLRDLGSRNGVFVGDERRDVVPVTGSLTIHLGAADGPAVELVPERAPADLPPPPPPPPAGPGVPDTGRITAIHDAGTPVLRIGRADDNDVTLDDLLVSRYHAELRSGPGGLRIVDLDSHNGTFVNGVAVEEAPVGGDDLVTIGSRRFRLREGRLEEFRDTDATEFAALDIRVTTSDGHVLVDDVSFALSGSTFLGVVGPSGSGKSTLLRALSGGDPAERGTVWFDGRDVYREFASLRTRIGMVPQDDIVDPDLTVGQALGYAAELRFPPDVGRHERRARVVEVMDELGLTERRDMHIRALSGGQRKRVSVATELLTRPALLFLDEPTSGLDPGLERSLMQVLRRLADTGRTVVCVTHSVDSLHLCDQVLFLAPGGRSAYFGPSAGATGYFDLPDLQTVFQELATPTDWKARFAASPQFAERIAERLAAYRRAAEPAPPPERTPARGWLRQFTTLTRRYARSLVADRGRLLLLLAAAPVLGLVLLLRLPTDELKSLAPGETRLLSRATAPLLLLSIAMTQLGVNLSAREIVRELPLFRRERAVGLSISAYVASKFAVLAAIGGVQALLAVILALARQGGPEEGAILSSGRAELVVVFFATWLAGMTLGLLFSALVTSEERLVLIIPAVIGLQSLAVTGTAVASVPDVPVLDQTEYVASASWGFTAAASTVELNQLAAMNNALQQLPIDDLERDPRAALDDALARIRSEDPALAEKLGDPDFNHDASAWGRAMLIVGALTIAALAGTAIALRRHDPL